MRLEFRALILGGCLAALLALAAPLPVAAQVPECRSYTSTVEMGGEKQEALGIACRRPDGSWQIRNSRRGAGDHDSARDAVSAGEVMPLSDILSRVRGDHPGTLLDARLHRSQREQWAPWYELKVRSPDDRVSVLEVDAGTGRVLGVRGGPGPTGGGAQAPTR